MKKFNGVEVQNLKHLAEMVLASEESFFKFDLDYNEVIVLDSEAARQSTAEMLELHSIPGMMSSDLQKLVGQSMAVELQQIESESSTTDSKDADAAAEQLVEVQH